MSAYEMEVSEKESEILEKAGDSLFLSYKNNDLEEFNTVLGLIPNKFRRLAVEYMVWQCEQEDIEPDSSFFQRTIH